jgi:hypothetical protein
MEETDPIAPPPDEPPLRKLWPFRHKVLTSLTAIVVLIVVIAISTSPSNKPAEASTPTVTTVSIPPPGNIVTGTPAPTHAPATSAPAPTPKAQPSAPHVLIKMSGNGQGSSAPFLVNTSTVTATYTYNCSALGQSGNFIADMVNGNQASLNSDDQSIANALGAGGSATTTLYPTNVGQDYHLTVNSECTWSVTLTSG